MICSRRHWLRNVAKWGIRLIVPPASLIQFYLSDSGGLGRLGGAEPLAGLLPGGLGLGGLAVPSSAAGRGAAGFGDAGDLVGAAPVDGGVPGPGGLGLGLGTASGAAPEEAGLGRRSALRVAGLEGVSAPDLEPAAAAALPDRATFRPPAEGNPLKSPSAGASKLSPAGTVVSASVPTFMLENFGAAVGPGIRTFCFGLRKNTTKPAASATHKLTPIKGSNHPALSGSAGADVGAVSTVATSSAGVSGSGIAGSVSSALSRGVGA